MLKAYRQKRKDERESAPTEGDRSVDMDQLEETVRVGEDFPARVRNERKKLMPFYKKCLTQEKNAYIKYDKLVDDIYQYILNMFSYLDPI